MIICLVFRLCLCHKDFSCGLCCCERRTTAGHNFNFLTSGLSYICTSSYVPTNLNDENPKTAQQNTQRSSTDTKNTTAPAIYCSYEMMIGFRIASFLASSVLLVSAFTLSPMQTKTKLLPSSASARARVVPSLRFKTTSTSSFHVLLASSSIQPKEEKDITGTAFNSSKNSPPTRDGKGVSLSLWLISISTFIIANTSRPWPTSLFESLSCSQWSFVHSISSMLFGGTIILSALVEYLVVKSSDASVMKFWFLEVPQKLDANVVLPALAGVILSGVAVWGVGHSTEACCGSLSLVSYLWTVVGNN